ncbi:MAG: autotransporter domain-containing protein [Alphaproteobacteria bacterium]|nr:autotransporter domain-containing protein [Alphaproteobacteria bacterium]
MTSNLKRSLLVGSALVAVGAFVAPNLALAAACADPTGGANCELSADPGAELEVTDGDTVTFDTTFALVSNIDSATGGSAGTGILTTDGSGITITQTGNIGTNPNELAQLTVAATDTWVASGNIDLTGGGAANLVVAGTLDVDAVAAGIAIATTNGIDISAGGVVTISDTTTGTANVGGAGSIDIATTGILNINDATGLTLGAIDGAGAGEGVVNFNDSFTLTNAIGGTNIGELNIAAGKTLTATAVAVDADDLNIGAGAALVLGAADSDSDIDFTGSTGTVTLGDDSELSGSLDNTSGTAGRGTLVLQDVAAGGNNVIDGAVGGTASIAAINMTGTGIATFSSTVAATTMTVSSTGTLDFDGTTITGNINLSGDGFVDLAATTDLTGAINNTSGNAGSGTLTVASTGNTVDISGAVGASNSLKLITLNGTGTTAFGSTVHAADITFGGAGTATFAGNTTVTNDIDFNNTASVVTFADGANFTGTIQDTSDDLGTVNFSGSSTVTGSIGAAANSVLAVNANGVAGKSVAISGNVDAAGSVTVGAGSLSVAGTTTAGDDINVGTGSATFTGVVTTTQDVNFTGDGTATFADAAHVIGDDLLTGTLNEGTAVFQGAGTITGDVGVDGTELKALTLTGTGKTLTVGGNFEAANTTTVGSNTIAVTGTVDVDAAQSLAFNLTGATTSGQITSGGAATVDAAALVNVGVANSSGYITSGQTFTLIDGTGGGGVADLTAGNITDNSFLLSFAQDVADNDNLVVTATRTSSVTASTSSNNANVATVLENLQNGGTVELDNVQTALNQASTQEEVNDVLESVGPTVDGGAVVSGFQTSVQSLDITSTRLASLRTNETGVATGNMGQGLTAWIQGFGKTAEQDRRDGIDGYDADTYGVAVGIDTENVSDAATLGLALSYANSDVDSENANTTESDIDSYQVSLYGDYDLGQSTYVAGNLGYARNNIDQTRHNVGGVAGLNANADYDSDQYIAYAELGRDYAVGNAVITPNVLAHYQHISIDDYTETGAGGANLNVDNDSLNIFELGIGADAKWNLKQANGNEVVPGLHVGYRHDLIGDEVESSSTFTGGGASFNTQGADPANGTFNVGASLSLYTVDNWSVSGNYDYEYKSDYDSHGGYIRAGYKF